MKKQQIIEHVKISALGYGGVGIARLENGKKILIKGALPDSEVDVTIVKRKKDYFEWHIIRVHNVAEKRLDGDVKCPHYLFPYQQNLSADQMPEHKKWCGWCKRQVVSYPNQLALKQAIVKDCFKKLTNAWIDIEILDVLPSPLQWWYRNKIEFSFWKYLKKAVDAETNKPTDEFSIAEHWQLWFHKQWEFSKVIDIDQCYLVSGSMHALYKYLKQQLLDSKLPVHDVVTHQGLLRHMVMREGIHTEQILVNISIATQHFGAHPQDQKTWESLLSEWKKDPYLQEQITTLVITENNWLADIVHGQDTHTTTVRGEWRIFEALHFNESDHWDKLESQEHWEQKIIRFQVSPFSFFQTNTLWAELLFETARKMAGHIEGNLIDLYCGSGTIGLSFLSLWLGKRVKGIEIVPSAVHDAYENAKINWLSDRADFYVGAAEQLLKQWVIDDNFFVGEDLIVVDPPRDGLHPKVVEFLITCKKRFGAKLLYISCNPVTMARDIQLLHAGWYSVNMLQPVDMFPHTHHVEMVGILR